MADDLTRLLGSFGSAVITVLDGDGRPVSARCDPAPGVGGFVVDLPAWMGAVEGRAGLMCHYHDARLWHQRSFVVRGRVEQSFGRWVFIPEQTIPGMGYGRFPLLLMMIRGRRRAARYLQARRLPRPEVPWDQMRAIKREAFHG